MIQFLKTVINIVNKVILLLLSKKYWQNVINKVILLLLSKEYWRKRFIMFIVGSTVSMLFSFFFDPESWIEYFLCQLPLINSDIWFCYYRIIFPKVTYDIETYSILFNDNTYISFLHNFYFNDILLDKSSDNIYTIVTTASDLTTSIDFAYEKKRTHVLYFYLDRLFNKEIGLLIPFLNELSIAPEFQSNNITYPYSEILVQWDCSMKFITFFLENCNPASKLNNDFIFYEGRYLSYSETIILLHSSVLIMLKIVFGCI